MKYKGEMGNFIQVDRDIFKNENFLNLSSSSKWLYIVLCECEHKYASNDNPTFYRDNESLSHDSGLSMSSVKRAKIELENAGMISISHRARTDKGGNSIANQFVTEYILN